MPAKKRRKRPSSPKAKSLQELSLEPHLEEQVGVDLPTQAELHQEDIALRKQQFLEHYQRTARLDLSTKAVGILYHQPYYWARTDEAFAEDWKHARKVAAQLLEDAATLRAKDGVLKPVYWKGMLVGMEREYSDGLVQFLLKGLKPEVYRENATIEHVGKDGGPMKHEHKVGLSDEAAASIMEKVYGVKKESA